MLYWHYIKLKAVKINIAYVICGTLQMIADTIKYGLHSIIVTINQCSNNLLASPSGQDHLPCCATGITVGVALEEHSADNSATFR